MNIKEKSSKLVPFHTLNPGDVFRHRNQVCMRTYPIEITNMVRLSDGFIDYIYKGACVYPISGQFVEDGIS